MGGKITLEVIKGPMTGLRFDFDEHDTLICGRRKRTCHLCLPKDPRVSRHHFMLEINPPDVGIRDLGSLNGTLLNGVAVGRRAAEEPGEPPNESKMVSLNHNDVIKVGGTELRVCISEPRLCPRCGSEMAEPGEPDSDHSGTTLCDECRREHATTVAPMPAEVRNAACQQCGKDVAEEIGPHRIGAYICHECQKHLASNPLQLMNSLAAQATDDADKLVKLTVRGYTIGEKLGSGGMGCVYKACRNADGHEVAVKLMLSKVAVSRRSRDRFLRESRTTMQLSHENIVRFLDCGAGGGAFYFVTECCNGGSLRSLFMDRGKISCSEAAPMFLDILRGLAYAHKKGFVHRDIKPSNILLHRTGDGCVARIADFGLAKNFQVAGFSGMTTTGNFAGTFSYMPREQLTNFKYITPASDVWSVAATFYELLTGCSPRFARVGADPIEVILDGEYVPISERDKGLPHTVAATIDRALATEVEDRFPNAESFLVEVQDALNAAGIG
jgi:hypothetical protein